MPHEAWSREQLAQIGLGPTPDEANFEKQRRLEQARAEAASFHARAYLEMPEDLRESAKRWDVSSLMEAVWMNAFGCGYKQAQRDSAARRPRCPMTS